jgi:hypothetical protein
MHRAHRVQATHGALRPENLEQLLLDRPELLMTLIRGFGEMQRSFRDAMRRALRPDLGIMEPAWRQAELIELYQSEVQRSLGRGEADLWEGGAEPEDEPLDTFARHCVQAYRSGLTAMQCARRWRCRSG